MVSDETRELVSREMGLLDQYLNDHSAYSWSVGLICERKPKPTWRITAHRQLMGQEQLMATLLIDMRTLSCTIYIVKEGNVFRYLEVYSLYNDTFAKLRHAISDVLFEESAESAL